MINWLLQRRLKARIATFRPQLYRTAYAWCHDPARADDLVQDTMVKAISRLRTLQDEDALRPWLYRIMTNCHRDWLRRQRDTVDPDDADLACEDCPEMNAERAATVRSVREAIRALSDDQRKVLTLVDLEGFSYSEVAAILEVPIGTVMSRLSRARQQLKRRLLRQDPGNPTHNLSVVRSSHEN
ncbi:RNA polymerase sigma factor [Thioalkalivibrio denitrificans]|uniref:RNA polymerase sigma factor n=1 Tax=Thioalkalivibrio denitrificans TaxID=108003 RepID=UPI003CCB802C